MSWSAHIAKLAVILCLPAVVACTSRATVSTEYFFELREAPSRAGDRNPKVRLQNGDLTRYRSIRARLVRNEEKPFRLSNRRKKSFWFSPDEIAVQNGVAFLYRHGELQARYDLREIYAIQLRYAEPQETLKAVAICVGVPLYLLTQVGGLGHL